MGIGKLWINHKALFLIVVSVLGLVALSTVCYFVIQANQPKHVKLFIDGKTSAFETKAETVEQFLAEQNVTYSGNDILIPEATAPLENNLTIVLHTSWAVPVLVDGQTKIIHTLKRNVAGVLDQAGITMNGRDVVEPALSALLSKETKIKVSRIDEKVVQVEEQVPFQEIRKNDGSLVKGETRIVQQGQQGKVVNHYKVVLRDGKEVTRQWMKRDVLASKQDRIVAVGTASQAQVKAATSKSPVTIAALVSRGGKNFRPHSVLNSVTLTAYSPNEGGGYGRTATGVKAVEGRTIAVDPSVIPLGWWVFIDGIGYRRAEDTGGAVNGQKIDVYFNSYAEAMQFGLKRGRTVYVIGPTKPD